MRERESVCVSEREREYLCLMRERERESEIENLSYPIFRLLIVTLNTNNFITHFYDIFSSHILDNFRSEILFAMRGRRRMAREWKQHHHQDQHYKLPLQCNKNNIRLVRQSIDIN